MLAPKNCKRAVSFVGASRERSLGDAAAAGTLPSGSLRCSSVRAVLELLEPCMFIHSTSNLVSSTIAVDFRQAHTFKNKQMLDSLGEEMLLEIEDPLAELGSLNKYDSLLSCEGARQGNIMLRCVSPCYVKEAAGMRGVDDA